MKSHLFLKIAILGIFAISLYSCSKDRLIPVEVDAVTEEVNPFKDKVFEDTRNLSVLSNAASKANKYTVNSAKDLPITTAKGTKLWIYDYNLWTQQYGPVSYPFDIEIIELYTLKDMILHRKPTTSFNSMLVTGGAIYLNVRKNGNSLNIYPYSPPNISIPAKTVDNSMLLFYEGNDKDDQFTWLEAPKDTIRQSPNGIDRVPLIIGGKGTYEIFPRQFGWINCDKFLNYAGERTQVSFVSTKVGLESIAIFMVFPNISSVIQVYQGKSLEVPVGEEVKIVALAQTKDGLVFSFFKDIKVEKQQTVEIDLKETTEKDFLTALDKL
jgi:hypothetical protein